MKMLLHRDRDFMMPAETAAFSKPYGDKGIAVWLTKHSDVESYWGEKDVIKAHFGVEDAVARELLDHAVEAAQIGGADEHVRNTKRNDHRTKIAECKNGQIGAFNDAEVVAEYSQNGAQQIVLGKTLCEKIRGTAQAKTITGYQGFGKRVPASLSGSIALDLKVILDGLLA